MPVPAKGVETSITSYNFYFSYCFGEQEHLMRDCVQTLVALFFLLIIQCNAMHGARIKNTSTIRTVEKKDNIKFPNSASFTLNIFSIQDINQVFQKAMEVIK